MRAPTPIPLQFLAVTIALLRGIAEFASPQRWRLKAWITR